MNEHAATEHQPKQLLHLVFGGELENIEGITFSDLSTLDVVGFFLTMNPPIRRGAGRLKPVWTMRICAILWFTYTGFWTLGISARLSGIELQIARGRTCGLAALASAW